MEKITFITGNEAKAKLLERHLHIKVNHKKLDIDEIQSLDLNDVVTEKAKAAFEIIKSPVLVEDVSLVYNALGKLPGPFVKWFLEEIGNTGLCRLINHYKKDRSATVTVAYCYFDGKESKIFDAYIKSKIAAYPRGDKGFGFDSIFISSGESKTWGEVEVSKGGASRMRKEALTKLEEYLEGR